MKLPLIIAALIVSSMFAPLMVPSAQAAGCSPTCDFEVNTNVPASAGTITVRLIRVGTSNYTDHSLNHTFTFANDTQYTLEVLNTEIIASGTRYMFKEWRGPTGQWGTDPLMTTPLILANYTSSGPNGPFWAVFERQFQASFSFTDPLGQAISPPTSITLQGQSSFCPDGGAPPCTLTTYADKWLSNVVWTVTDARWQGMSGPIMVHGTQTIDMRNGPLSAQIALEVYSATVRVVDMSNNPISGASLTVRFLNQTELTFITDGQGQAQLGHIPLGLCTVVRIVYQTQEMDIQNLSVDTTVNPVNTIQLNVGGTTSGPIISAVVLLTIFGLAMFLLLLAIKVRRPPLPPTI